MTGIMRTFKISFTIFIWYRLSLHLVESVITPSLFTVRCALNVLWVKFANELPVLRLNSVLVMLGVLFSAHIPTPLNKMKSLC